MWPVVASLHRESVGKSVLLLQSVTVKTMQKSLFSLGFQIKITMITSENASSACKYKSKQKIKAEIKGIVKLKILYEQLFYTHTHTFSSQFSDMV